MLDLGGGIDLFALGPVLNCDRKSAGLVAFPNGEEFAVEYLHCRAHGCRSGDSGDLREA